MPVYTYRCSQGHEWDEVRSMENSERSEEPCKQCLDNCNKTGIEINEAELPDFAGRRVVSQASVKIRGGTPRFYPNRGPR